MTDSELRDARVSAFAHAAEAASAAVRELSDPAEVASFLLDASSGEGVLCTSAVAGGPVGDALARAGGRLRVVTDEEPVAGYTDAGVGVVAGELAVAETGSVLVAEHALADRVVSMLCRHLVEVVDRDAVVDGLDEVARWLADRTGGPGFAALVTGPSRSADIERSLTVGVQGPEQVTVVITG